MNNERYEWYEKWRFYFMFYKLFKYNLRNSAKAATITMDSKKRIVLFCDSQYLKATTHNLTIFFEKDICESAQAFTIEKMENQKLTLKRGQ